MLPALLRVAGVGRGGTRILGLTRGRYSLKVGLGLLGSRWLLCSAPMAPNGTEAALRITQAARQSRQSWLQSLILTLRDLVQALRTFLRALNLLRICLPLLLLAPVAYYRASYRSTWFQRLVATLERCGPIFVKLGQWASTRRDLFPLRLCQELAVLQKSAKTHPWAETKELIERTFDKGVSEVFEVIEETPFGSGCCAQVHKATLKTSRGELEVVAVKVLHPKIRELFTQDLRVMEAGAYLILCLAPNLSWLSLEESLTEFAKLMECQLDLLHEANNLGRLAHNFRGHDNVIFPRPLMDLCSKDILVETLEEGIHVGEFLKDVVPHQDRALMKKVAEIGVSMLLKMIFKDNLVHGDLHPGNILVRIPTKRGESPKIVILDPGIVSSLTPLDMDNFKSVFKAVILGDGCRVGKLFLERSFNKCNTPEEFIQDMEAVVLEARSQQLSLNRLDVSKLLKKVFNTLLQHRVKLESNFASVILAILVLEGLGRTLDPELDLILKATPYVMRA